MAADEKRNKQRMERGRERGEAAGRKAKGLLAGVAAIALAVAAFAGQVVPTLALGLVNFVGFVGLSVSVIAIALAAGIRRSSDEPKERMAWAFALAAALAALLFFMGR